MTSILAFIVVLGVLIVVHELGHFITAKLAGISVPRFSVGFGPKVLGFKRGETEYVISALPLGGYVKMAGMGEDEALEVIEGGKDDIEVPPERRFDSKSIGTRAVVISAGVVMNFIFAVIVYAGLAYFESWEPLIGEVKADAPAAEAGLQAGDLILAVDGNKVKQWREFAEYVSARPGGSVVLTVARDGHELELETRVGRGVHPISGDSLSTGQIGVVRDTLNARRVPELAGSLVIGTQQTVAMSRIVIVFLGQLFSGQASARDIGGPIMIGQISGEAARAGIIPFLTFMAILSVHLAVLNLLPIPILDGGHLVFLAIEGVRGRALSIEARARLSQVGLLLILGIMVWALTADVLRLTGN
ncbi:MAG: RIP metalloprotease RseP [Gemmatimonadota bacterium]|nr:MAG: RIP metalloprotease RseP [Gemmatimonadota bacterium]